MGSGIRFPSGVVELLDAAFLLLDDFNGLDDVVFCRLLHGRDSAFFDAIAERRALALSAPLDFDFLDFVIVEKEER